MVNIFGFLCSSVVKYKVFILIACYLKDPMCEKCMQNPYSDFFVVIFFKKDKFDETLRDLVRDNPRFLSRIK